MPSMVNLVQVGEVGLALVLVGQLVGDVLFEFAVVDVQHELGHDLLRIRKHLKKYEKKLLAES